MRAATRDSATNRELIDWVPQRERGPDAQICDEAAGLFGRPVACVVAAGHIRDRRFRGRRGAVGRQGIFFLRLPRLLTVGEWNASQPLICCVASPRLPWLFRISSC